MRGQGDERYRWQRRRRAAMALISAKAKRRVSNFFECRSLRYNDFLNGLDFFRIKRYVRITMLKLFCFKKSVTKFQIPDIVLK